MAPVSDARASGTRVSTVFKWWGTAVVEGGCALAGIDVVRERRTKSDDVYRRLRDAIVDGELRPGERLRDGELAESLGTSPMPVRHALVRLAEQGLVEMHRNGATRVAPPDLDQIRDAIALFGDSWIGSVRHAMPLLQEDDVAYLVELTDDMSAAGRARDVLAYGVALRAIAIGFARLEGNALRESVIELLGPQIRRFTQRSAGSFDWTANERSTREIREAIVRRDAVQTRAALVILFDDVLPGVVDRTASRAR